MALIDYMSLGLIMASFKTDLRFQSAAIGAIQKPSEDYLVGHFGQVKVHPQKLVLAKNLCSAKFEIRCLLSVPSN